MSCLPVGRCFKKKKQWFLLWRLEFLDDKENEGNLNCDGAVEAGGSDHIRSMKQRESEKGKKIERTCFLSIG